MNSQQGWSSTSGLRPSTGKGGGRVPYNTTAEWPTSSAPLSAARSKNNFNQFPMFFSFFPLAPICTTHCQSYAPSFHRKDHIALSKVKILNCTNNPTGCVFSQAFFTRALLWTTMECGKEQLFHAGTFPSLTFALSNCRVISRAHQRKKKNLKTKGNISQRRVEEWTITREKIWSEEKDQHGNPARASHYVRSSSDINYPAFKTAHSSEQHNFLSGFSSYLHFYDP